MLIILVTRQQKQRKKAKFRVRKLLLKMLNTPDATSC